MTTTETITDRQISDLATAAAANGDILQAAIAAHALGEDWTEMDLTAQERARVQAMTRDEARAECARVYADAEAAGEHA